MINAATGKGPKMYCGPFNTVESLGIDRGYYIAIRSADPAAAAKFATDHMGFDLVHVDSENRHYLGAHGLDPYSLVYTRGKQGEVDHIAYVIRSASDLPKAAALLDKAGVKAEQIEHSPMWRQGAALRFQNPSGHTIQLTPGVNVDVPMASVVAEPKAIPAPITFDHAVVRVVDVNAAYEFASRVMGLRESARIVAPDEVPVLGFFRAHTIFHCYAVARSQYDGLHHMQFTFKNPSALYAAHDKMKASGKVGIFWGPLRHGPGHNIVFYFKDYTGNIVEYSTEEEIILNDATYVPRAWSITDPKAGDEWKLSPIPPEMM
jgi:catechol 2,3-dioxygenase